MNLMNYSTAPLLILRPSISQSFSLAKVGPKSEYLPLIVDITDFLKVEKGDRLLIWAAALEPRRPFICHAFQQTPYVTGA